jgi:hypothetical protein
VADNFSISKCKKLPGDDDDEDDSDDGLYVDLTPTI